MFSGIVEEVGTLSSVTDQAGGRRLTIRAELVISDLKQGDSVAVSGVCLTAIRMTSGSFTVEATQETLRRTKLGSLNVGDAVNLERALRVSDRLGGHIVSGHVDAVASVVSVSPEGAGKVVAFATDSKLAPFFVEKGSVAVDGVSLTVAALSTAGSGSAKSEQALHFSVALIPHTLAVTTLGSLKAQDRVNIEADLIGKYVARLVSLGYADDNINKGALSLNFLAEHGYTTA